ncbi:MAG: hypothetical protein A2015_11860 [Spirochaetes bacterium GWF1_31_7]|nr:MAG: hypothetical protein A2Y30_15215 [Spirochaetes bacterium GWE1_32_154]OHD49114.1 MAG: hypothetical protein A2015_11860 [Spirochaetes bacterium GWF1_31_7]OHD82879.1 MAG: hypothetical protein A2355_09050 [Spirochaetes bacterium RIFOXYB1_FULL_32_8]
MQKFVNSFIQADFEYIENNDLKKITLQKNETDTLLNVTITDTTIQSDIIFNTPTDIQKFSLMFKLQLKKTEKFFMNGYQSWTDTREFSTSDSMRKYFKPLYFMLKKHKLTQYGDYNFVDYSHKKGDLHGFSYCYILHDDKTITLFGSLNEFSGYTIFKYSDEKGVLEIAKDVEGVTVHNNYQLADIAIIHGEKQKVFNEYFTMIGLTDSTEKVCTGWTSWYNYYENISQTIILDNLSHFQNEKIAIDCFQIDDGYQTAVGDWLSTKSTFPSGMKYCASKIKEAGYTPGIWLAPFVCETKSDIFNNHNEWLLRDTNGEIVSAGSNWSGFYVLDMYNEDVRSYLTGVFKTITEDWGYKILKLDFLYAVCLIPQRGKSRGQVMCEAVDFLKEIAGSAKILGCGVPLLPAAGRFEYCRIGCDAGLEWVNQFHENFAHRERVSTLNALHDALSRSHLNHKAFLNDPDVFFLRSDTITMSPDEKHTVFLVNNITGSLLFTSDNISKYNHETKVLYNSMFPFTNKEIISITNDSSLYTVQFKIKESEYTAYINLSGKSKKISFENGVYYTTKGFINHQQCITLNKHSSLCGLKLNKKPSVSIAGSTGHLFPGSDVSELKMTGEKITLTMNAQSRNKSAVYILLPDQFDKSIVVNETLCPVIEIFGCKIAIYSSSTQRFSSST